MDEHNRRETEENYEVDFFDDLRAAMYKGSRWNCASQPRRTEQKKESERDVQSNDGFFVPSD